MTFETTTLDSSGNFFDSAETDILSAAFEKAWGFVKMLEVLKTSKRRGQVARCLMALLKLGKTDPALLANSAIRILRRNQTS
jgi:hypothetical protein